MRAIEEIVQEGRLGMVAELLGMHDFDDQAFQFLVRNPEFKAAVRKAAQEALRRWDENVAAIVAHVSQCHWCRERALSYGDQDLEEEVRNWRRVGMFRNIQQFVCAKTHWVIVGKPAHRRQSNRARAKS